MSGHRVDGRDVVHAHIVDGDGPVATLVRDAGAIITAVDEHIVEVLGWRPDELIGLPSTTFIHPEDQPSAVTAWMAMLTETGSAQTWCGRYRAPDGSWRWIETVNENRLHDDPAVVRTTMRRVAIDRVNVEEELRARKQLLSRLSDALPVGLVQIDADRLVTFTNDRLHAIVGVGSAATLDALLAGIAADDRALLEGAVAAVLSDEPVDDVELRLERPVARTCLLSLRALTDADGRVNGAIGCLSDVTDRANLRRQLETRATIDPLTQCLNRGATLALLAVVLAQHDGMAPGTAVMFVDLDRFKDINDTHGHAAGDEVLQTAADRLRCATRTTDHIGRLGGDEFLVICPGVETLERSIEMGYRLIEALNQAQPAVGPINASIGVAWTARGRRRRRPRRPGRRRHVRLQACRYQPGHPARRGDRGPADPSRVRRGSASTPRPPSPASRRRRSAASSSGDDAPR